MALRESEIYTKALSLIIFTFLAFVAANLFYAYKLNKQQALEKQKFFCGTISPTYSSANKEGKHIYKANCAACHMMDKYMTGPELLGVFDRIPSELWFNQFVVNENDLINQNDEYTLSINATSEYEFIHLHRLTDQEMISLKAYIVNY